MYTIHEITDYQSEDEFINKNPKCVIFFGSQMCGHCQQITPLYHQLSQQYPNIAFGHVEAFQVNPRPINLEGVPTFAFYRNKVAVDKVLGANETELRSAMNRLAGQ